MVKVNPNYLSRSESRYKQLRQKISGTRGFTKRVKPTNSRSQTRSLANTGRQRASHNLSRLSRVAESRSRDRRPIFIEPLPPSRSRRNPYHHHPNPNHHPNHNGPPSFRSA